MQVRVLRRPWVGNGVEVWVLGPIEALVGGRPAALGGPRQRTLLGLLATAPGGVVPTARLIEELWEGRPPAGAETTLRSYVSRLRVALGRDAVSGRDGGYALELDANSVDAHRFDALVRSAAAALGEGAAGRAAERARAALGLWRGEPFAGVETEMLRSESRRLFELRLAAIETRGDAELALGRFEGLVPELQALVREEPLRERLWRQLVLALYRSGRQADALAAYREAQAFLERELGLSPGAELRELELAILRQELAPVEPAESRHNLPAPPSALIGRERVRDELARLVHEYRLVTITGIGGSGKTRLALEVAHGQVAAWSDGVFLVELTGVLDGALVPAVVAAALEIADAGDEPAAALSERLRTAELLLVLDNCEHVVGACAQLVESVLRDAPRLAVLATSRVALALPGEREFALDPLELPPQEASGDTVAAAPAVRLFLERVREVRRDLPEDAASLDVAAAICRALDGLPLALELAAARGRVLSMNEIAARLDDRFRFLRAWRRVGDPRHRTLETTMDWSYALLADDEQQLLRRLGVFAGGTDFAAIEAVAGGDDILETVGRLVGASLVRASGDPTRYVLLETVRQYAAAKLDDTEAEIVRRAHAEHYLQVARQANLSIEALGSGRQDPEPVLREQHNLRVALDWATKHDVELAFRLMLSLENFWVTQALYEGVRRYDDLFARAGDLSPTVIAGALRDRAAFADILGDLDTAAAYYARSRVLFVEIGDANGAATLDFRLGLVAHMRGNLDEARGLFKGCLRAFRASGYTVGVIQALSGLGYLECDCGGEVEGARMIDEAIELAHQIGWRWFEARTLADRAAYAVSQGRADEAEVRARRFLSDAWKMSNHQDTVLGLAILARVAALRGDDDRARTLWSAVSSAEGGVGRFGAFDREEYEAAIGKGPLPPAPPLADAVAVALG